MNIDGQVSYQIWIKLPKEVRDKLVQLFHIPRSGSTVVDYGQQGNVVVSDGYKPTDIETITLEKMQALLDTDRTNFYELFSEVIEHADRLLKPKDKEVTFYDDLTPGVGMAELVKDLPKPDDRVTIVHIAFCDTCTSKGGRHLKTCPKRK